MEFLTNNTGILTEFLKYGVVGAVAVLAMIIAYKKDKEARAAKDQMVAKSEANADRYHAMLSEVNGTMKDLVASLEADEAQEG
jgi:hypothetical protein